MYSNFCENVNCFVDGSCLNNGKVNSFGVYGCVFPDYPQYNTAEQLSGQKHTNNRAEYTALIKAIEIFKSVEQFNGKSLVVYSDSLILVNTITKWICAWQKNNWKDVKNVDLVKTLYTYFYEDPIRTRIVLKHIRAHTNKTDYFSKWNNEVDTLVRTTARTLFKGNTNY